MSTAQNLRAAAVSFPMNYVSDLDSTILWCCFCPGEDTQAYAYDDYKMRTFMLIVAESLDSGWFMD